MIRSALTVIKSDQPCRRVVILYRRHSPSDEEVVRVLEKRLAAQGFSVFIDRSQALGVEWALAMDREIRSADAVIPLLSRDSLYSEMLFSEVELASEVSQNQNGRPQLLPIRIAFEGPLSDALAGFLDERRCSSWRSPEDSQRVADEIVDALQHLAVPAAAMGAAAPVSARPGVEPGGDPRAPLEPVGGAVPLNSKFYVSRLADTELATAIGRRDGMILIKGARQMGKTSLLARGLHQARQAGAKVVLTDCQKLNLSHLESVQSFFLYLAEAIAQQLDLDSQPAEGWDGSRAAHANFERFLQREVLQQLKVPLVWGLDEVDRLFQAKFCGEVFGLWRSWYNERALNPTGPWAGMMLLIAYATEAHLFIQDANQSPFNIGTRLIMEDFNPKQVAELNERHGSPLKTPEAVSRFIELVRGHPYLVRSGLHQLVAKQLSIDQFEALADADEGIFGDHLGRILILLARDPALRETVCEILRGQSCSNLQHFYRLRSAGVMGGDSRKNVYPRAGIYATFLKRHLLGASA